MMKQFATHTHGMPATRQKHTDPIPKLNLEKLNLSMENTQILASVNPPLNFPRPSNNQTGPVFTRVYMQPHEYECGLNYLSLAIRKHLQKHGVLPKVIYTHPDIYIRMSQDHFNLMKTPLNHVYHTYGPYLQPATVTILTSVELGVEIPREVMICQ